MYVYSNRNEKKGWKTFLVVCLTAVITVFAMKYIPPFFENESEAESETQRMSEDIKRLAMQISGDNKEEREKTFVEIIRESMPSVVGVSVLKPDGEGILDLNVTEKWGIGTGVILSAQGYILTNQHLASKVNGSVTITLDDGREVKGRTVWNESNLDLAIVKIEEDPELVPATLGTADLSQIGEEVIAIGNPLGLEFQKSVTKGVISGMHRTLKVEDTTSTVVMEDLIQTDASINTGNSGGPLINQQGEVIGINTVKITSAEGIGFAVPIDIIKPILAKLERDGTFEEGYLGIFAYDAEIVPYLNRTIETNQGIYVATVNAGGPAQKAGLRVGDIIVSVDGNEFQKMTELREYIYGKIPGNQLELKILRNGQESIVTVTLGRK